MQVDRIGSIEDNYEVTILRLDNFIEEKNIKKIDLMKIDVELHEIEVLEGMGRYIEKYMPIIIIEILNLDIANKVYKMTCIHNYNYYYIDEENGI